jgi:DNA-binding MarR family transcriptional regulator
LDCTRLNSDDAERLHAASLFPISHGIFRLARAHRAYAADLLRELALFTGQELIIMTLAEGGPQRPSRLAGLERLDHSTIAHSLRRMETAGLVSRKPCGDDRRATIVSLTPKGRALYKRILRVWEELERVSAANLDESQRDELLGLMKTMEKSIISNVVRDEPARKAAAAAPRRRRARRQGDRQSAAAWR